MLRSLACVAAVALVLAGCERSGDRDPTPTRPARTSSSPVPDNSRVTPEQLTTAMFAAVRAATSFRVVLTDTYQSDRTTVDLHVGRTSESAHVDEAGYGAYDVVQAGSRAWVRGEPLFYTTRLQTSVEFATRVGRRWVSAGRSDPRLRDVLAPLERGQLFHELFGMAADNMARTSGRIIGGVQTLGVRENSHDNTAYVRLTGTPYPLKFVSNDFFGEDKVLLLSGWQAPYEATAPAAADTVALPSR